MVIYATFTPPCRPQLEQDTTSANSKLPASQHVPNKVRYAISLEQLGSLSFCTAKS